MWLTLYICISRIELPRQDCSFHGKYWPTNIQHSSPPLIRPLPPKDTPLIKPDLDALRYENTNKLFHSREATPLIRPLLHCKRSGLIRGGQLYKKPWYFVCCSLWKQLHWLLMTIFYGSSHRSDQHVLTWWIIAASSLGFVRL